MKTDIVQSPETSVMNFPNLNSNNVETVESIAIKETLKSIFNDETVVLEHRDHTNHTNATVH